MAAFRFPLEKVLEHRRRLVDLRARDLAAAGSAAAALAARIAERRDAQRRCETVATGGGLCLDVRLLAARTAWIARLDREIATLEKERGRALAAVATARAALQAAWRDREVLAQLRARRQKEWERGEARRETAALDEIGSRRGARAGRNGLAG